MSLVSQVGWVSLGKSLVSQVGMGESVEMSPVNQVGVGICGDVTCQVEVGVFGGHHLSGGDGVSLWGHHLSVKFGWGCVGMSSVSLGVVGH